MMIRDFCTSDSESVLDIWLRASIQAHHFVAPEFWHSQLDAMRDVYLPSAITRVLEADGAVIGFCSVYQQTLAALFVSPEHQGRGVGAQLLADAMSAKSTLELSVYAANASAIRFYEKQGFVTVRERLDEHTGQPEKVMCWRALS